MNSRRDRVLLVPGVVTAIIALVAIRTTMWVGVEPLVLFPDWHHPWTFYLPWLAALPFVGAVGVLLSSGSGGLIRDQQLAALGPVIGLLALMSVMLVPQLLFDAPRHGILHTLCGVAYFFVCWVAIPGALLLCGASAFQAVMRRSGRL